jgi:acyl-CoA thioesterase FadM
LAASFRYPVSARFFQADPAGVLFYGRIFELFHEAYAAFLAHAGVDYATHFGIHGYATPIVHAEVDYRRPIRPGEPLFIDVTLLELGRSSLSFAFLVEGADGVERATGRETHVTVHPETFATMEIPSGLRSALAPFEAADV